MVRRICVQFLVQEYTIFPCVFFFHVHNILEQCWGPNQGIIKAVNRENTYNLVISGIVGRYLLVLPDVAFYRTVNFTLFKNVMVCNVYPLSTISLNDSLGTKIDMMCRAIFMVLSSVFFTGEILPDDPKKFENANFD
jgi:hypothetical protein